MLCPPKAASTASVRPEAAASSNGSDKEHHRLFAMAPPPPPPEKFTDGELPELDEAGYASLILRTANAKPSEPVYERIKGERPMSQE